MSPIIEYIRSFPPLKTMIGLLLWALGLMVLLTLWQWQLERLQWKQNVLEMHKEESRKLGLPILSDTYLKSTPPAQFSLKRFDAYTTQAPINAADLIFVGPRPKDEVAGYHVYAPMPLKDTNLVLITMLGWVAQDQEKTLKDELDGTVWPEQMRGYFIPDETGDKGAKNFPDQNIWVSARLSDLASHYGLGIQQIEGIDMFEVDMGKKVPNAFFYAETQLSQAATPRKYSAITFRNDHAYYAQFWLAMAFAWTVIFLMSAIWPIIAETLFGKKADPEPEK